MGYMASDLKGLFAPMLLSVTSWLQSAFPGLSNWSESAALFFLGSGLLFLSMLLRFALTRSVARSGLLVTRSQASPLARRPVRESLG